MRIPEHPVPEGIPPSLKQVEGTALGKGGPRAPAAGPPPSDQVVLSQRARELQQALAELRRLPAIREELVADLKRRIEEGTYEIDGVKVAEKLLEELGGG